MEPTHRGMRRSFYEYEFYRAVQDAQDSSGRVITVSAARALRDRLDESLTARGMSMDDPRLGLQTMQASLHDTLQHVPGYAGQYADPEGRGSQNPAYVRARDGFFAMTGFSGAPTGSAGPRLPISPYDPRWATRATVKQAGSALLYVSDQDVEQRADGDVTVLTRPLQDLMLFAHDPETDQLREVGEAYSRDDRSGMTELMGYMTRDEYRKNRSWVIDQDPRDYMSAAGLNRAKAVLDELREQGVGYSIVRDQNKGQLAALVEGTKISVRLTDTRANEKYVGRVYDDGISTYYSTNHQNDRREYAIYEPTPTEAANLLRMVQGLPVERSDGRGIVGEHGRPGDAYYDRGKKTARFLVGDYMRDGRPQRIGGRTSQVFVHRASDRSETSTWFGTPETGARYLELAVESAQVQVARELGAERLIQQFHDNAAAIEAGDYAPEFSGDEEIAGVQRAYWAVLRDERTTLLRPGASRADYDEAVSVLADIDVTGGAYQNTHDMLAGNYAYTGTAEERIRAHAADMQDRFVGTYEAREVIDDDGYVTRQSFDPARVAKYMISEHGVWRNSADLVAAMRASDYDGELLMGESSAVKRVRDDLVVFDESSAVDLDALPDGFVKQMGIVARDALRRNGVTVEQIRVDDHGILDWQGIRRNRKGEQLEGPYQQPEQLHGQIGQLFERGDHGEVVTRFASGENYMFVPGYEARIIAQKAGEELSVEERTRLRGYEQIMAERIRYQIAGDAMVMRTEVGGPTTLNGVYRRLYDERHPTDYLESAPSKGLDRGWAEAVLATEARRVRYPDQVSDTFYESWAAGHGERNIDPANDNFASALALTGGRNIVVMGEDSDGYFDPDLTNAARPGQTRFLVESATVDPRTGAIVRGELDDRTPVMKHPELETIRYDPYDRRQMTGMNLLHATSVTRPHKTALMTFGGWGADDGIVVSREFAEEHVLTTKDGRTRPLIVGDKLSDLHGNKGVISLIVDRENDLARALRDGDQSMIYAATIFQTNPDLDVVMSPFSAVSRYNGGTAREMMDSSAVNKTLALPFKGARPAAGTMRFIVTHKAVDASTRVYDEDALAQGGGRKASAQLAWALGSQGAVEVMREFYGPNGAAVSNLREMLVVTGMDMGPDGTLRAGVSPDTLADRRLIAMPELKVAANGRIQRQLMNQAFAAEIATRGGDMEVPFPLRYPAGGESHPGEIVPRTAAGTYRVPVLSSHLRVGQDLGDGTSAAHEYTTQYMKIFEASSSWRLAKQELDDENGVLTGERRAALERRMAKDHQQAQSAFDTVTGGIIDRQLTGKHNIFKEGLMSARLPHSATAVWSADPRLDIDQIGMNQKFAEALNVEAGEHVLIWRDPVLRDAGVRYLRVAIDERLTGVSINPAMTKGFDGDFDGDSVAVVKLTGARAQNEAMSKLSVPANLLDLGAVDDEGNYPLMMHDALDTKVTQHVAPRFREQFADLHQRANNVQADFEQGEITAQERLSQNRELMGELSAYYRAAMEGQYGDAYLRFDTAESHLQSVREACIDTEAKGSPLKLAHYARHLGVGEDGRDAGTPLHSREEDQGVMVATAVKAAVGIAGAYSQRGVKGLRNVEQKPVLELTYPVTQSLLQAKHDPHEAMQKYGLLLTGVRDLWKGRLLEQHQSADGYTSWKPVTDDKHVEVQATLEQWQTQFMEIYTSPNGLNIPTVDRENVERVAQALAGADGRMRDIEEVGTANDPGGTIKLGSSMDRLAYGGTFADLRTLAGQGENLFDGTQNGHFAPYTVRHNQREIEQLEMRLERRADDTRDVAPPIFEQLANPDVLTEGAGARARGISKPSRHAPTARAPRFTPTFSEPAASENDAEYEL